MVNKWLKAECDGDKVFDLYSATTLDSSQRRQRIDCGVNSAIFILDNAMEMK